MDAKEPKLWRVRKEYKEIVEKEGNKKEFVYKGYNCLILRIDQLGHLCGYVGLTKDNDDFGKHYDDIKSKDKDWIDCHGGLTFSSFGKEDSPYPKEIGGEKIYWIGFDCCHYQDVRPYEYIINGMNIMHDDGEYKTMEYVEEECKKIVDQIIDKDYVK